VGGAVDAEIFSVALIKTTSGYLTETGLPPNDPGLWPALGLALGPRRPP
jgi:hypothetical protein